MSFRETNVNGDENISTFTLALPKSLDALEASSNGTAPCSFASLKSSATILLGLLEAAESCNPLYSESPE